MTVARLLENRRTVLLHCSDGWDRTPQLSGLAQLLVDPEVRTLEGLLSMVGREWTAMGHRWSTRTGVGSGREERGEQAPVWLLWLECVAQLMQQHPRALEASPELLVALGDAALEGRWTTFCGDNEKERQEVGAAGGGGCFLSWVLSQRRRWTNAAYQRQPGLLAVSTGPRRMRLWDGWWLRYLGEDDPAPEEEEEK